MSKFFIKRPIVAMVIAILTVIVGAISITTLPVAQFPNIVPWLMLNREGLAVLVHPLTDSNYDDHSKYALWLGTAVPLRLERLSPKLPESLLPKSG